MAKKLNTIQQRNFNNLLTAVESNDRTTAKELFERFFKGKERQEGRGHIIYIRARVRCNLTA